MNTAASYYWLAQAFGWAVLHSLWQIALIWVIFKAATWVFRSKNQLIYLFSLTAMLAAALWFSTTVISEYSGMAAQAQTASMAKDLAFDPINTALDQPGQGTATQPTLTEYMGSWLETHAVLIGWAWGCCVALLWLRLLGGWWMVQRLRRRNVVEPATKFQEQCQLLAAKLNVKALVKLLESPHVSEPLTLGFWKPVILFPAGMFLNLSPAQVEALLLHELAHIRRHDYLINLFQLALETCFFYHPLFWLISRDARVRREFCCDDVVLYHTSDPILYARTLTDLQISFIQPSNQFTMNATGKSRFTERILRIAGITPKHESRPNFLIVMLLPAIMAIGSLWPAEAHNTPTEATSAGITTADTLPPQKAQQPIRNDERPKKEATVAEPSQNGIEKAADGLGKIYENQRLSINLGADAPENVAIEVVKMNILYIGVDNPLRIAAAGVPSNEIQVQLLGKGTISGGGGNYIANVTEPGEVTVRVLRKSGDETKAVVDQKYRVKRVPDPTPRLSDKYRTGTITKEQLLASKGITTLLDNFDFDAVCNVSGFELTILPKESDPVTFSIIGAEFSAAARAKMDALVGDGDGIFIDDIKVKCPGDAIARNLGGLAFKLKPADKHE